MFMAELLGFRVAGADELLGTVLGLVDRIDNPRRALPTMSYCDISEPENVTL